jgi:hypothetical protein
VQILGSLRKREQSRCIINNLKGIPMTLIQIENRGQQIVNTNYWDSPLAAEGKIFMSWNAGAARLLMPDSAKQVLREMRSAKHVIISRGPYLGATELGVFEILFEDFSDAPFMLLMAQEASDRTPPAHEQGEGITVSVWTRGGQKLRKPGKYRVVDYLPCLKPWSETNGKVAREVIGAFPV